MWRIGAILFAIGFFIISPIDEIIILTPLSTILGLWIFPVTIIIGLLCLVIGAILIGKHIIPLLTNPIVMLMLIIAVCLTGYIVYVNNWISW